MIKYSFISSSREAEAGRLQFQGYPGLYDDILFKKRNPKQDRKQTKSPNTKIANSHKDFQLKISQNAALENSRFGNVCGSHPNLGVLAAFKHHKPTHCESVRQLTGEAMILSSSMMMYQLEG